jgi:lipase maturation factor 1
VEVLFGHQGLLPAARFLDAVRDRASLLDVPTLFWLGASDATLRGAAVAGAVASLGLVLGLAPRGCLAVVWVLYLSFVAVGQDFLAFQWDNLLLESVFFALFVAPAGLRPRRAPEPHPIGVFLMQWLLFRLYFESGAFKLLLGDPTWRDLTAMASYYETAPLPTWVGWWAHQLPLAAQRATSLVTLAVELGLPFLVWGPRRVRPVVFGLMAGFQVFILLTANYGIFNYLSLALGLWVLDDGHLASVIRRFGGSLLPAPPRAPQRGRTAALAAVAAVLVALTVVPAVGGPESVWRRLAAFRTINAYHLFAQMTLVRNEIVIEGSDDGVTWKPYEFRWKPGDPMRAPAFVAPHQPRVDFQLWFLLLGGRPRAAYFQRLLDRLLHAPKTVAPLFAVDPFPDHPPRFVRGTAWRYHFTDRATRRATGAWWTRELLGHTPPVGGRDAGAAR